MLRVTETQTPVGTLKSSHSNRFRSNTTLHYLCSFRQGPFPLRACFLICKVVLIISVSEGYWGVYIREGRWAFFCASPWEWLCSSCALRSEDTAQETDGNVSSSTSHPKKGSKFLLQLLYWAEVGGDNNKKKRVGDWKNTFLPLTHCEHITSGVEWVLSLLKYQILMPGKSYLTWQSRLCRHD